MEWDCDTANQPVHRRRAYDIEFLYFIRLPDGSFNISFIRQNVTNLTPDLL